MSDFALPTRTTVTTTTTAARPGVDAALLVARVLLVAIFPISGWAKISTWPAFVPTLGNLGLPFPELLTGLGAAIEFICPLLVILGVFTRPALLVLMLYVAAATAIGHRFWEFTGAANFAQTMSFMKNLAMLGAMGLIAATGPGRYAVRPSGN